MWGGMPVDGLPVLLAVVGVIDSVVATILFGLGVVALVATGVGP